MALDVEGKFFKTLEPVSGEKNGKKWSKQFFVIELPGQYTSYGQFTIWNDRVNLSNFKEGDNVKVFFDINSREFNGRVYTDLVAYRVDKVDANGNATTSNNTNTTQQQTNTTPPPPTNPQVEEPKAEGADDLPF